MMKLYGVHHGGEYSFGGLSLGSMSVSPAEEMLQAIHDLPKRSTVGVEFIHPEYFEDEDNILELRDEDEQYWQEITDACADGGHSVAYLDSYDIHRRAARKRAELAQLRSTLRSGEYHIAPGQERTVTEISFGLEAEIDYLHAVAREDHIIQELEKLHPGLAIIGLAHSDYVMLNPELAVKLGVSEYWKVLNDAPELPIGMLPVVEDRPVRVYQYLEQSPPDPSRLNEREFATRTKYAVSLGRIMLGTEAEWIGSWELSNRPYGLFELYPTSVTGGTVEDRLGTAEYTGEFEEDRLEFTKKYIASTTYDPTTIFEDITYDAVRTSETDFEGSWITYDAQGKFIIRKGSHLFDPVDTNYGQQTMF